MSRGDALPTFVVRLDHDDVARYAAASGDHNPIHREPTAAAAAGLPGVVAHGLLVLAHVLRAVADGAGAGVVREVSARFTRPVAVPAELTVEGAVTSVEPDGRRVVELLVSAGGRPVARVTAAVAR
ncbi:MaoC/PaaZ C-terminal domain-containing protein [Saccharothrix australiensis]|uniref:MaoC dehydratase-like protein n=1 Tax=Saccharothrix australiensis TaxID=2072 RepID=A0A495W3N4_9PSEU|nr:MaoC/PaaZ C-terminal domain-containing protein [Saccharothrix australiensis]RKT55657.1 MaoC dehydratase-like protein [Saccharothrix australiensis]